MLNVIFINVIIVNLHMTKVIACYTTHFHLKQKKIRYGTLAKHARAHLNEFLVAVPFSAAIHHIIDVIFDIANVL